MRTPAAWLLYPCISLLLNACDSTGGGGRPQPTPAPSSGANFNAAKVPAKACLSVTERSTFSLQRTWWSPAGLGYCVGVTGPERCIELQVMPNAFVAFASVPTEAREPRAVEHPLKRTLWSVTSGIKVCDARRAGQLDQCSIIETSGAALEATAPDSDDSSALATKQRLLTADISTDRKHLVFVNKSNSLVVQALKPKGADRFLVKTLYTLALGDQATRQLWWAGDRVALKQCVDASCTLSILEPMNPKATPSPTGIAIGRSLAPLHAITETEFIVVNETGDKAHFFDLSSGIKSSELTLPRKSTEGVWAGKSGPGELAVVYGKPNLGDVVRVHLQRRVVNTVNTAGCE